MAPQTNIPVSATVLGTIGTILWCIQLIPQIWTNWRTKSTDGLPGTMMFLWAICGVPFGAYSIVQNFNVPIQVQPQCFMGLCLVSWAQVLVYGRGWRAWTASLMGIGVAAACAGVEAALILTLRVSAILVLPWYYKVEKESKDGENIRLLLVLLPRVRACVSVFVFNQSGTRRFTDRTNSQSTLKVMRRQYWLWV